MTSDFKNDTRFVPEIPSADKLDDAFIDQVESVCSSIAAAGFDPYSQLTGYLRTGNDRYITRTGNARSIIATLDKAKLQVYVKLYLE